MLVRLLLLIAEVEVIGRAGPVGSGGEVDGKVVGSGGAVILLVLHAIIEIIPTALRYITLATTQQRCTTQHVPATLHSSQ